MANLSPESFTTLAGPLRVCGPQVASSRDEDAACWIFDGLVAFVETDLAGTVHATFADRPVGDAIAGRPVVPVYHSHARYQLTGEGSRRLGDDLASFFGGVREPRFSFVGFADLPEL